jgi:hypothetical protein
MRKNSRTRFLPVVIFPAILPAILMPVMRSLQVPDFVIGFTMGSCIGLTLVGIYWMIKGNKDCSTDNEQSRSFRR